MIDREKEQSTYKMIDGWLKEYHSSNDVYKKSKAKTLIVVKMLPIIKRIARTIARRSYDPIDDMVQAGAIGLLKAIDNYSEDVSQNFKIFAGYYIIGEMKHYLRDKLHTIRVPRGIQELAHRINMFTYNLTLEELNELTNEDVAEALNVPKKQVDFVMQVDRRSTLSLEEIYDDAEESRGYEEIFAPENSKEKLELEDSKIVLKDVIEKLPEHYKELVKLYYYKDFNQREIAKYYNYSPIKVSRELKKAFRLLYRMIADEKAAGEK